MNCDKCKMQLVNNRFNAFKMNDFNSFTNINNIINVKKIIKPFKYNCKTSSYNSICHSKCKMQHVSINFNILKVNGSIHVLF